MRSQWKENIQLNNYSFQLDDLLEAAEVPREDVVAMESTTEQSTCWLNGSFDTPNPMPDANLNVTIHFPNWPIENQFNHRLQFTIYK